jgi:hypothetical protein
MFLQASSADAIEEGLSKILLNESVGNLGTKPLVHEEQFMLPLLLGFVALLLEFLFSNIWMRKWPN